LRILELSLRNFRVFEEVDLELPARVIGIFGPNGAGKSTLVESVAVALYGVDAARTKKDAIRTTGLLTDCEVRLVFEHGGGQYAVRRAIKGKNHQVEAELFGGGLQLASGVTDVDAEIQRLLRMDRQVFRASVFAEQKQLDAFSDVTAGKRKEMVLRLLGVRPVDDARGAARKESRTVRDDASRLAGALPDTAAIEAELKEARDVATEAGRAAAKASAELGRSSRALELARARFEAVDATRQEVEKLTVELGAKTEQRDTETGRREELAVRVQELDEALRGENEIREELDALAQVEERLRAAKRLVEVARKVAAARERLRAIPEIDLSALRAELAAADEELAGAGAALGRAQAELERAASDLERAEDRLARAVEADPTEPCPTCGRPLGEDFRGYLKHCRSQRTEARRARAEAAKAEKQMGAELTRAEKRRSAGARAETAAAEKVTAREQLAEHVEALGEEFDALAAPFGGVVPEVRELENAAARAKDLEARIAKLEAERKHLLRAKEDLAATDERIAGLETELDRLVARAAELAFDRQEHARLLAEVDEADTALERLRAEERSAGDAANVAEKRVSELRGALGQARETASKVSELQSEARYLERVTLLLDGFRDHLVARIGPELSREAEALFRELTSHEYDDLRIDEETLTIQIADGDRYFGIDRFSGSEGDLANLALRVAISMHLSRVSGADVGMLVLDEVLGSLDVERRDLFVQAMGRLSGRFHQLFVITHAEQVKDQFPASIEVRRIGRRRSEALLL
jgi:exonuclease SbcC